MREVEEGKWCGVCGLVRVWCVPLHPKLQKPYLTSSLRETWKGSFLREENMERRRGGGGEHGKEGGRRRGTWKGWGEEEGNMERMRGGGGEHGKDERRRGTWKE
jgi:hypothetical protein